MQLHADIDAVARLTFRAIKYNLPIRKNKKAMEFAVTARSDVG